LYDLHALLDRAAWLEKQIGLQPVGPILKKQL
jgi:hypothetical protein